MTLSIYSEEIKQINAAIEAGDTLSIGSLDEGTYFERDGAPRPDCVLVTFETKSPTHETLEIAIPTELFKEVVEALASGKYGAYQIGQKPDKAN